MIQSGGFAGEGEKSKKERKEKPIREEEKKKTEINK